MNTHVAKLMAFNALLNITDLLAPNASTQVINSVILNAIKSGGRPTHFFRENEITLTQNNNVYSLILFSLFVQSKIKI